MDIRIRECRQQLETEPLTSGRRPVLSAKQMHSQEIWYSRERPEAGSNNHVGILCGKTDSGDWIAVHCSSSKNGVTVGEAYSASFRYIRKPSFYQDTTAEENETTAIENDVLTEESAEKLLTDVVRSDALKDALASGDTVSSDLLADFKNKALQEDEEEDEVETLTLDKETMDDAVDTFDDDVETLEMEN